MLRHGFAALVVLALVLPLVPAAGQSMACCRGGGDACACPVERGFSRCDTAPPLSPPQAPLALLPPAPPSLVLMACFEGPTAPSEAPRSLELPPSIPPPRS